MPEVAGNRSVSRSAWLELREEQKLVNDGYEFLDEKAILLAAEMLEMREAYAVSRAHFLALCDAAADELTSAVGALGLDGLQVYPAAGMHGPAIDIDERQCVGQTLLEARFVGEHNVPSRPAVIRSGAAERSGTAFLDVLRAGAELAALSTNLERLAREYRRTWRRVRALENVVLPEIQAELSAMEEHLDLVEQEEVIRVRTAGRSRS